ncbi:hypothetical protein [Sphingobacterium mizutaii]|uniref:hypothetical protein n=1 Tax=Sphingobacterium mizutaii TaxID=1010 RepID=UPI003D99BDA7
MKIEDFFCKSALLDSFVLRPLSHIRSNWDLYWDVDKKRYKIEEDSFAKEFNDLITELETISPAGNYHEYEDKLAEYVASRLNWGVEKNGNRWTKADYESILEQGGFFDVNEKNLLKAASGRINKAIEYGQNSFDEMEMGHLKILSALLTIILYHRDN